MSNNPVSAAAEGMPECANRIGANPTAAYRVATLASLLTVCSLALEAVEYLSDEVRERSTSDVRHVLEFGALYADKTVNEVDRAIAARGVVS